MKLELSKQEMISCRLLRDWACSREETLEMIVPDIAPDVGRVLDTCCFCCLTRQELTETGIQLAGTIRAYIIYQPEKEEHLERLEAEIPFQHSIDGDRGGINCVLTARGQVMSAQTRVINSRKLLIKADIRESLRLWEPEVRAVCSGICSGTDQGVQEKKEHFQMTLSRLPREKRFIIEDELELQDGKGDIDQILSACPGVICTESRIMGSKVIVKGVARMELLCRRSNGELCRLENEFPVSQMLDADETGEGTRCQGEIHLLNWHLGSFEPEEQRASVTLEMAASVQLYESLPVQVLTDSYSTKYSMKLETKEQRFQLRSDSQVRRSARESVNTEEPVRHIHACRTELGLGELTEDTGGIKLRQPVTMTVLYQTESGRWESASKRFDLSATVERAEDRQLCWSCDTVTQEALLSAAGIELRLTGEFRLSEFQSFTLPVIAEAELDDSRDIHQKDRPSIVLRAVGAGEDIWQLAKSYSTTCQAIREANGLEGGGLREGQMLLVPCKR